MNVNFLKPGKGGAYYKTKLKEIPANKIIEKTFKSGEMIKTPEVIKKNLTFLYKDHRSFHFLNDETYDQHEFAASFVDEGIKRFLKEGEGVILTLVDDEPIHLEFKKTKSSFKVIDAPPALKGNTVSNVYRPAKIETGAEIMVPLFIKENDTILINVETGEYCSRDKE